MLALRIDLPVMNDEPFDLFGGINRKEILEKVYQMPADVAAQECVFYFVLRSDGQHFLDGSANV